MTKDRSAGPPNAPSPANPSKRAPDPAVLALARALGIQAARADHAAEQERRAEAAARKGRSEGDEA